MMNPITLRPIVPEDRAFLARVYVSTRQAEFQQINWSQQMIDTFLNQQFEYQQLHYTQNYVGAKFQIVLAEQTPIGRLYEVDWEDAIRIIDISLLPEWRNQGIGKYLINTIIQRSIEKQIKVSLHVEQHNPAQFLYERLGFIRQEEQGIYYLMERQPLPLA